MNNPTPKIEVNPKRRIVSRHIPRSMSEMVAIIREIGTTAYSVMAVHHPDRLSKLGSVDDEDLRFTINMAVDTAIQHVANNEFPTETDFFKDLYTKHYSDEDYPDEHAFMMSAVSQIRKERLVDVSEAMSEDLTNAIQNAIN